MPSGGKRKGAGRKSPCPNGTETINVRICREDKERLATWCEANGTTISRSVAEMIQAFFANK